MADVDGTLIDSGDISSPIVDLIRRLEQYGITVGLVSGRTLPELERMAASLGISGPVIAENGGLAKLAYNGSLLELDYSRKPAIKALQRLKSLFPGAIEEREDNKDRRIDMVFWSHGLATPELEKHTQEVQLLDSGYIRHVMQKGISKGKTLRRVLGEMDNSMSPSEVLVFGDSTTDISLFESFPHSVLVVNPKLSAADAATLRGITEYVSNLTYGDGFAEVVSHILAIRRTRNEPCG